MKSKKFLSLLMAGALTASLSAPAFAATDPNAVAVEGTIQLPTINVVLPTTASMILNPYQLNVKLDKNDADGSEDGIISPLMTVKNLSNIGIQVGANVKGVVGKSSGAVFATGTTATSTDKEAFVYAKFLKGNPDMSIDDLSAETTAPTSSTGMIVILSADADGVDVPDLAPGAAADTTTKKNILAATSDTKNPAEGGVLGFRETAENSV